jgi:hypothetical protein
MQKHFWFVSNFEHIKFAINEKYSTNFYGNPNYHVFLVIFQTYKNVILRSIHSLKWFLWLCFYLLWFFPSSIVNYMNCRNPNSCLASKILIVLWTSTFRINVNGSITCSSKLQPTKPMLKFQICETLLLISPNVFRRSHFAMPI